MKDGMIEDPSVRDNISWREILKEAVPLSFVLVVYFAVMAAISAESIAWYLADCSANAEQEVVR